MNIPQRYGWCSVDAGDRDERYCDLAIQERVPYVLPVPYPVYLTLPCCDAKIHGKCLVIYLRRMWGKTHCAKDGSVLNDKDLDLVDGEKADLCSEIPAPCCGKNLPASLACDILCSCKYDTYFERLHSHETTGDMDEYETKSNPVWFARAKDSGRVHPLRRVANDMGFATDSREGVELVEEGLRILTLQEWMSRVRR